jgi:hypothetical protein
MQQTLPKFAPRVFRSAAASSGSVMLFNSCSVSATRCVRTFDDPSNALSGLPGSGHDAMLLSHGSWVAFRMKSSICCSWGRGSKESSRSRPSRVSQLVTHGSGDWDGILSPLGVLWAVSPSGSQRSPGRLPAKELPRTLLDAWAHGHPPILGGYAACGGRPPPNSCSRAPLVNREKIGLQ